MLNRYTYSTILIIGLLGLPFNTMAQNNPFKIDDKLYKYFDKCMHLIHEKVVLNMSDTLFAMSKAKKDVKSQCLAMNLKGEYYYFNNDLKNLKIEKERVSNFAKHTPYKQYVFSLWNRIITYYITNGLYDMALIEVRKYQQEAIHLNNDYGIGNSYRKMGDIYYFMHNYDLAIKEYRSTLDYFNKSGHQNENYNVYAAIATLYLTMNNYAKAEEYYMMALKESPFETAKGGYYIAMCQLYLNQKRMTEFNKYMDLLKQWKKNNATSINITEREYRLYISYYITLGEYDKAIEYANRLSPRAKYVSLSDIYLSKNDYKNGYEYYKLFNELDKTENNDKARATLTAIAAQFDNERIENEKNRLALQNAILMMSQMKTKEKLMAGERERNELMLSNTQLELNNRNLDLNNKNLELKNNRLALLRQQDEMAKQRSDAHHQHDLFLSSEQRAQANKRFAGAVSIILILLVTLFSVYIILRRRSSRRLHEEMSKVKKAKDEAERANRVKTYFMQNMSHEIRTPLNAIVGFSLMLTDPSIEISKEEKNKFSKLIQTNSESLTNMVNDILDTTSLDTGTYHVTWTEVHANTLCEQTVSSLTCPLEPGVELLFEAPTKDVVFDTDTLRTKQLLTNLLTNACKYTEQGSIILTYKVDSENIVFSVTDTGCGISSENAERIFNRFEKLDTFKQGTGLGLNICRQIAQLLHGEVKLDKSYHNGSRFIFSQPIKRTI